MKWQPENLPRTSVTRANRLVSVSAVGGTCRTVRRHWSLVHAAGAGPVLDAAAQKPRQGQPQT
eukprot:1680218-Prymnesium_polylepis.1